jgi:hypothetical protein
LIAGWRSAEDRKWPAVFLPTQLQIAPMGSG